jgi:hypothetical protein
MALYMPLKPGILLRNRSQEFITFLPIKLLTNAPVIIIINSTKIIPEPGMVLSRLNIVSGKYCGGIMLFINSKKNLITTILSPNGIQKSKPEIK